MRTFILVARFRFQTASAPRLRFARAAPAIVTDLAPLSINAP
jgi:hypothetical protein